MAGDDDADLGDRRGIKQELRGVDEETRAGIVRALAAVIRAARKAAPP